MRVLITGCAGFIGFHTALKLLERGETVVGLDNLNDYYSPRLKGDRLKLLMDKPGFNFTRADLTDRNAVSKLFARAKFDVVCHLAAQAGVRFSLENPYVYIDSNVMGTTVIFEAAKESGLKHLVYASSSSVYGKTAASVFQEDARLDWPISLYAATKKSTELIAHAYYHLFGIQSTGLRYFTVYGPWGRPDMFAFLLAQAIHDGTTVKVFNKGLMHRDFTYIDDIVAGTVAALDKPLGYEVLNLGGAKTTLLNDFIALIEAGMGKPAKKKYLPLQKGDVLKTAADVSKVKKLLGWKPQVSLEEGIAQFCVWFKQYYPTFKKAGDYR